MWGKFFSFGTQISSKFAGGSGAEKVLRIFFEKSSSLIVKTAPDKKQGFSKSCFLNKSCPTIVVTL